MLSLIGQLSKDGSPFLESFRTGKTTICRISLTDSSPLVQSHCPQSAQSTAEVVVCHLCSMGNPILVALSSLTNQTMRARGGPNFSQGLPGRHCRSHRLCCDSIFDYQKMLIKVARLQLKYLVVLRFLIRARCIIVDEIAVNNDLHTRNITQSRGRDDGCVCPSDRKIPFHTS